MAMKKFTLKAAESILREMFAPWIHDLGIGIDRVADGQAILRVPVNKKLNREGGTVCGQAIMAVADTAMVFAISSALDSFVPMTTVSQSSSFLRPAADRALIAHARVIKLGRKIVFGEVNIYTDVPDKSVAHVTSTYILL